MVRRAQLVLAIALASCGARHSPAAGDDLARDRYFVCTEIPNMLGVDVPPSIVEDTLHDALRDTSLTTTDLKCLEDQAIPDRVMDALRRHVRAE